MPDVTSDLTDGDLVLVAPEPVTPIADASVRRQVKLDPEAEARAVQQALDFVTSLSTVEIHTPEFDRKLDAVRGLGQADIRKAAGAANRMLERPLRAMEASGPAGESAVGASLLDLRRTVEGLDPSRQGLIGGAPRRILEALPFGNRLRTYFGKYASAQKHLNAVIEALLHGQDELRKDNAAIEQEKASLWASMRRLRQYALVAEEIDAGLERQIAEAELEDPERALVLRNDAQFQVRQRLQDLMTQLAVTVQGYLALDLVRKNNLELIKGVDRATTTTVAALRTAVVVAQALANQKLVLSQITALNTTTGNLIESTSVMLRQQSGEVYAQAADTTVSLEKLQAAFANVYAAIDSIDEYKARAVESMRQTVEVLGTEVGRAQTYLDRTHREEDAASAESF